jgi:hypothetical protein
MTIFKTFENIENASGSNEIKAILKNHKENDINEFMKEVLSIAFDSNRKFWISKIPDFVISENNISYEEKMNKFFELIHILENRIKTGNDAKELTKKFFETYPSNEYEAKCFKMIITKHFSIGFSRGTIDKLYPGLIQDYPIQLCTTFDSKRHSLANRIAQRKYNGFRGNVIFDEVENEWKFLSRNGNEFSKTNYHFIENELNKNPEFKNYFFDCEIDCGDFQLTSSVAKTGKLHPNAEKMVLRIFDCLLKQDWVNKKCEIPLSKRIETLSNLIDNSNYNHLFVVESEYLENENDVNKFVIKYMEEGNDIEGAVFKDPKSTYNFTRDDSWLRVKPFETEEFKIISINQGTGKNEKWTGSITVEGIHEASGKFIKANVAGIKDDIKKHMWENKELYIGNMAEISFQYVTNDNSLRHSNFIHLRNKFDE